MVEEIVAKKVLILIEPSVFYLGDSVIVISHLRSIKNFFEYSLIDVNYNFSCYEELFENNPFINKKFSKKWEDIDFEEYDFVLILHPEEDEFLGFLVNKYQTRIKEGTFRSKVYSLSTFLIKTAKVVFPINKELTEFIQNNAAEKRNTHELFISGKEIEWGNEWFKKAGVKENDKVIVLVDETTSKRKLLRTDVFFETVNYFLEYSNVKVVVLDRSNLGKESVYEAWLGQEKAKKLIFVNGMSLRPTLALLSSNFVKMVFGPCTGILHCAAAIYGHLSNLKLRINDFPFLVVYTGQYLPGGGNAFSWWGKTLVNCLILKKNENGEKCLLDLKEFCESPGWNKQEVLACSEYDQELILNYFHSNKQKLRQLLG